MASVKVGKKHEAKEDALPERGIFIDGDVSEGKDDPQRGLIV